MGILDSTLLSLLLLVLLLLSCRCRLRLFAICEINSRGCSVLRLLLPTNVQSFLLARLLAVHLIEFALRQSSREPRTHACPMLHTRCDVFVASVVRHHGSLLFGSRLMPQLSCLSSHASITSRSKTIYFGAVCVVRVFCCFSSPQPAPKPLASGGYYCKQMNNKRVNASFHSTTLTSPRSTLHANRRSVRTITVWDILHRLPSLKNPTFYSNMPIVQRKRFP